MIRKYYYGLLIMLALIPGCKKENNPQVFAESSYPLAVGDWWQYQLISSGYATDTFSLNVVSKNTVGTYTQFKCYFIYQGTITDSAYFSQSDTSLSFIFSSAYADYAPVQNFHIKLPAYQGESWPGAFAGDSILVTDVVNSYSSYGHTYGPCYYTKESYNLPHNFKVSNMILTPKVGLIYQSIDFNSDTAEGGVQVNQSITLISYHVQ